MLMRTDHYAAIGFALATLAGCAAVGPNFQRPASTAPDRYAMAGDQAPAGALLTSESRVAGPWWRALGSPPLDKVMAQALAGNHDVAAADAVLATALREADVARGHLGPQADLTTGAERERINFAAFGFPTFPSYSFDLYSVGGVVTYDLDLFGGGRRGVEAAAATAEGKARRADAAYLTLTANVALQSVRIAGLRAEMAAVEAIVADDRRGLAIIRQAEAAGGEPSSATTSGLAQLAEDESLAPPLAGQLSQARHALAVLVGKAPAEWAAPDFDLDGFAPPARVPVSLPSSLLRHRPDILAAEAELHRATAEVGVATADLYPDIRLQAGVTQSSIAPGRLFSYDSTGAVLGAGLTAPIFHGGALRAEKAAAEANARAALAQYRQTVVSAFGQVADILTMLAHDDDEMAALTRAEAAARSTLDDANAALRLGGGPALDAVGADRNLERARLARIQAQGERLLAVVELFAATATDWR
jgi:NodT family efflux transporter outer membrane factor (OMF) lipoprotein